MPLPPDRDRVLRAHEQTRSALLAERNIHGHWEGELSTSALSTATAVMALEMVRRESKLRVPSGGDAAQDLRRFIQNGIHWLANHQNPDGGWGDTTKSISNISTTMLCHAVFHATGSAEQFSAIVQSAKAYIDNAGGVPALRARYGKDKTFSIPILTHCALASLVDWRDVSPLPFELACLPHRFYKTVRMPVVSYALPALIAIGQVRHHFVKPWNPLTRFLRNAAIERSLKVLERIQPTSGGFLEATPLTSFVTMSLAGMGRADHPVARKGIEFLIRSVRCDGSWPIDTNLATWVTTLSINALGPDLPGDAIPALRGWLLGQQYKEVHPYTNADPGGWAWTDLAGGVPDGDDTPGGVLALINMQTQSHPAPRVAYDDRGVPQCTLGVDANSAVIDATGWLQNLQNRDGGWPTFCRGWGTLPFDRSSADITAHVMRAMSATNAVNEKDAQLHIPYTIGLFERQGDKRKANRLRSVQSERFEPFAPTLKTGFQFLGRIQRSDGSWLPLWFGNQHEPNDENPTYGTARVLAAYRDCGRIADPAAVRGIEWIRKTQNSDGGWGGGTGSPSTTEETALALEVILSLETEWNSLSEAGCRGLNWMLNRIDQGIWMEPSPIGFYFAKLWYFERLYPIIFTVAALRRAAELAKK